MLRGVAICILVALAGAALYITKSTWAGGPGDYTLKFPDRDPKHINPVAPREEFACDSITEAVAYENGSTGPLLMPEPGREPSTLLLGCHRMAKAFSCCPLPLCGLALRMRPTRSPSRQRARLTLSRAEPTDWMYTP